MAHDRLEAALAIARERHRAIAEGDNVAYAALDADIAEACGALVADAETPLAAEDIPALDELIALETQSRGLLETLMAEASSRMETLRHSGRANGAYLRQERLSVNGV